MSAKIRNESEVIGKTYSFLTIIRFERLEADKQRMAVCQCTCGSIIRVFFGKLTAGHTKSCGCYRTKLTIERSTKHGMARHPLAHIFQGMLDRCTNPNSDAYKNYGGRGITVCDEWLSDRELFFNWALDSGWVKGLHIDRKENDKGYSPSNCRFVTQKANNRNKRSNRKIFYRGETKSLCEWCEFLGINYSRTRTRLSVYNYSVEDAFNADNLAIRSRNRLNPIRPIP